MRPSFTIASGIRERDHAHKDMAVRLDAEKDDTTRRNNRPMWLIATVSAILEERIVDAVA